MHKQYSKNTSRALSAVFLAATMLFTQAADAPDALYESDITPFCANIPDHLIAHHEAKYGPIDRNATCPFAEIKHGADKTYSIF
jgi:hypothetical protein